MEEEDRESGELNVQSKHLLVVPGAGDEMLLTLYRVRNHIHTVSLYLYLLLSNY